MIKTLVSALDAYVTGRRGEGRRGEGRGGEGRGGEGRVGRTSSMHTHNCVPLSHRNGSRELLWLIYQS